MSISWKKDLVRAAWIFAAVAVLALIINWTRTPMLSALSDQGPVSGAFAYEHRGVFLVDDWSHHGRPIEKEWNVPENHGGSETGGNENDDSSEPDGSGKNHENLAIQDYYLIDIEQAKMLYDEGDCIFIDARSPEEYETGHIPGAINWPHDLFDEYHDKYRDTIDFDDCLVVYCENETCDFSADVAEGLVVEYYQTVFRFEAGIDEWNANLYPVIEGTEPYNNESE